MFEYIVDREDCVQLNPLPGVQIWATEGERMSLTIMQFEPGTILPEHTHPHEQLGYMIEGEAKYVIDGKSYQVGPGQMWRFPSNVPHEVRVGDKPMRVIEAFCPVREDFRAKDE